MSEFVFVESPYAGNVKRNEAYACACVADCIRRGENPLASHLFFTQPGVLDDTKPEERKKGIALGFELAAQLDAKSVFYVDLGFSNGMMGGFSEAKRCERDVELRCLPAEVMAALKLQPEFDNRTRITEEEHALVTDWLFDSHADVKITRAIERLLGGALVTR